MPQPASDPLDIVFEHVHELEFLESSLEGALCIGEIARRAIPALGGLVHLLDAARGDLVVAGAFGERASVLSGRRTASRDAFFEAAVASHKATLFTLPRVIAAGLQFSERHTHFGWPDAVLVLPVFSHGRLVAVIELVDPIVGEESSARSALTYLGERFATFLGSHAAIFPH